MREFVEQVVNSNNEKVHIYSLGQAGFLVKSKTGQLLAIDPYLSDCVERVELDHIGYKRLLPKILSDKELVLNVLICTHFHRDHYDMDSVPNLMDNEKTFLLCPEDCKKDIESEKISRCEIIKPGITKEIGDFIIHFINCDHGTGAPLAVGVIVEVDGYRILEVGDTCLRLDRRDEYLSFGDIDVMIAPINGKYGNLNEEDFIKLADAVNPNLSIPCHYGMFAAHGGNLIKFYEDIKKTCHKFVIMGQGEDLSL